MNETTVSGSIAAGPAVGLGTQRRVQEEDSDDGTKAPDAPKAKEFGLWKNSVLAGAEQRDKKKSKKVAESKRNEMDIRLVESALNKMFANPSKKSIAKTIPEQWILVGQSIKEQKLTKKQIVKMFEQLEQNRLDENVFSGIKQYISSAWNSLSHLEDTASVKNFETLYNQAAEKLKAATGGDAGVMKYIEKYRTFAKSNPVTHAIVIAVILAAAGVAMGAGAAATGAAVGLLTAAENLVRGKTALKSIKHGVMAGGLVWGVTDLLHFLHVGGGDAVHKALDATVDDIALNGSSIVGATSDVISKTGNAARGVTQQYAQSSSMHESKDRNEMDTPAVQSGLKKMADRHNGENWTIDQLAALGKKLSRPVKDVPSPIKSIRHKDGYTEFSGIDKEILRNKKPNTRKHPTNEKPKVDERDLEEGWKNKLAGAALAGAAALGGGGHAQAAPTDTGSNATIVKSLVNPAAQQRFAAQHADTTAKLSDPRYDHNPDALSQHNAYPKEQHDQWIQNVKNVAEFDNPYQIIRIALNMAGVTPQEVLQNLPKGFKLPTTEPKGTFVPKGTPRNVNELDCGSGQRQLKLAEENISEEQLLAKELARRLDLFMKGLDRELGKKSSDRGIQSKTEPSTGAMRENKKSIGPDKNDPFEKGWRAGFRHDESNPYPTGSKQAAQWDRGYAEAEAQPNHYDESVTEDLNEDVGGNYLYHATDANGLKGIFSSGQIRAANAPQNVTIAQTKFPTVSVTRDWNYAIGGKGVSSQFASIGRQAIIVLDRNAVESNFKTLGTSQDNDKADFRGTSNPGLAFGTSDEIAKKTIAARMRIGRFTPDPKEKIGQEFEESVVVPKGGLPIKRTMVGFYIPPDSSLMKDPEIVNDPRRLDLAKGGTGRFVKAAQQQDVAESDQKQLSVQQLATISDEALDNAYHYGRSSPGNTFGWQANLKSAAYAKQMIDKGITDIEAISDAIHKGWNVTAKAFVQNPDQFDDTEKLKAAGKLEAKLQQREKLMNIGYAQLPDEEQEKDRVVARALLQALKGQQDVAEDSDPCWSDYKQVGMKKKNGKKVPNCVPKEGVAEGIGNDQKAKTKIIEMMKDALDKEARIGRGDDKSSKIYFLAKEKFGQEFADSAYEYGALHVNMLVEPSDEDEMDERNAEMQELANKMGYKHINYSSDPGLDEGVAEATGDTSFDSMMGKIVKGARYKGAAADQRADAAYGGMMNNITKNAADVAKPSADSKFEQVYSAVERILLSNNVHWDIDDDISDALKKLKIKASDALMQKLERELTNRVSDALQYYDDSDLAEQGVAEMWGNPYDDDKVDAINAANPPKRSTPYTPPSTPAKHHTYDRKSVASNISGKDSAAYDRFTGRDKDMAEATGYKSQFPSAAPAIQYAKDKVKTFRDPDDGIEIWSMPDGGCDVVHTSNSNGRYHVIDNRGKKLGTIRPQKQVKETSNYGDLDEVAPPHEEKLVRKLKKEYPGHPEKAFGTAWSIYNKKHGKK